MYRNRNASWNISLLICQKNGYTFVEVADESLLMFLYLTPIVLKNLEIKAFKVFMVKSGDKGEVTNIQSVDSKKIPLPLEPNGKPKCQVGGIRVGLHKIHPTGSQSVRLV